MMAVGWLFFTSAVRGAQPSGFLNARQAAFYVIVVAENARQAQR